MKADHTFAVVAYKDSPYIEECIVSLKKQTIQSEIFISTSTPSNFLKNISNRYNIPLMVNPQQDGIGSDWSFAYQIATTKYLTLAHQDDIYLSEYSQQCIAAAENYSDMLMLFTGHGELINGQVKAFTTNLLVKQIMLAFAYLMRQELKLHFFKKAMLAFGNPICCPSVMFKKTAIGEFEFSKDLSYNLDWDAWLRLSQRKGSFIYLKQKLMMHRVHKNSALILGTTSKSRVREDMLLFEKNWPAFFASILCKIYSISYKTNVGE